MPRRGPHNNAITWNPHLRVSWGGTLGTGKEIWTNTVRFLYLAEDFVPTEPELAAMDAPLYGKLSDWMLGNNGGKSFIGVDAKLTWLKVNPITAQGLQFRQETHQFDYGGAGQAGYDANSVPFYQTYAVTLRTALKRGRAHAGRFFPPLVQPVVEAGTGMCSAADAALMATAAQTLLDGMRNIIVAQSQVGSFAVFSPGDTTKGTTPRAQIITGVVVDRVPDVQHRRTNRIPRSEGALAVTAQ